MTVLDAGSTVTTQSTEEWTDSKRYLWLFGLVVPSLAFAAWGLHTLTGWGVWWWIGPIVVYGVVPVVDLLTGLDKSNPPDDVIEALENDRYYRWITYLYLPIQYAALVWACWMIADGGLSLVDRLGLSLSIGMIAGIGINTAHELGHKKVRARALAGQGRARADLLRPLLHRAQPRAPRPRRDARRTPPAPASVSRCGRSCPAPSWGRCAARGTSRSRASAVAASPTGRSATTSSTRG